MFLECVHVKGKYVARENKEINNLYWTSVYLSLTEFMLSIINVWTAAKLERGSERGYFIWHQKLSTKQLPMKLFFIETSQCTLFSYLLHTYSASLSLHTQQSMSYGITHPGRIAVLGENFGDFFTRIIFCVKLEDSRQNVHLFMGWKTGL